MPVRDDATVAAAKLGDSDAWQRLYTAHAGRLVTWLGTRRIDDCACSPEDVAAESWLVAAQRIPNFTGTSDEFAGWLFGIGRKVAANQARAAKNRSQPGLDADQAERQAAPVEGPDALVTAAAWVRSVLMSLPPRERDVLACQEVVGLDTAATARALDMSQVAVRVTRHRGLRRLRLLLSEDRTPTLSSSAPCEVQNLEAQ